jgi:polysaccharide export outer membrane protein
VRLQSNQLLDHRRTTKTRSLLYVAVGLLLLVVPYAGAAHAQQQNSNASRTSDVALQNVSRVAGSAAEIKAVLAKDSGLMIELKHWVARDASDHGQILNDSDLTNEGIYERLDTDIQFRSIATALVQRYGYLLPKLNPDSDLAKEHELLVQERTKWLAQNQEQELAQARQRGSRTTQNTEPCDPQLDRDCNLSQTRSSTSGGPRQGPLQEESPSRTFPPESNPPNVPSRDGNSLLRTQLTQTGEDSGGASSQNPTPGSYDSARSFNNLNVSTTETSGMQTARMAAEGASGTSPAGGNSNAGRTASDGLLAAYGLGTNSANGTLGEVSGIPGSGNNPPASAGVSPAVSMQPSNRRFPPTALLQPPEMIRKSGPYEGIPSLYDMYVQAVTRPAAPRRFGAEVFENGTRDSQLIPMDLPVGPDYVVGPGDGLSVDLWGGVSQRLYRVVDREGRVSLPEVGPILVSGKSLAAVQQNLQQILRTQFRDVSADVSLARLRTIRVYEVGDVTNPGAYDISSLSTPLNALFSAGGPTERGSMRILKHYRGTQLVETVDVYDLLLHGVKTDLQRLENGDTVQVPPIGPQVTVEGMVRRPAIYELRDEKTLASVLELAGGLLPAAALRHIEVQRLVAHEKQTMLSVDIPEGENAAEVTKKLEAFEIQDGDRIRIFPIVPYNQDTIYVEGHVVRPGRYTFRADMRVTDVISSFKDLLPEPATQYAEIIRLNAPDFHPSVESFDLAEALANPAQAPILHAMDTVRIFSRFDFENTPTVTVWGDVRAPGTYPTSGQIHLSDAIHLAGGLSPDAQTGDAQVFRYLPDGKFKIFSVSLGQALEGDPIENTVLQPRDRILIHRNMEVVQPATVSIQGEVAKPGRYPLAQGMHVSDVIRLGGGLKHSADTEIADLSEYVLQNKAAGTGTHHEVHIAAALAGNPTDNLLLHDGDTLTIRQIPGWNDLGANVTVHGEMTHPGSYGIHPGERLSSVLERAGGFLPTAYPRGIVFVREDVRQLEQTSRDELIQRVKQEGVTAKTAVQETGQDQAALAQAALAQQKNTIEALEQLPVIGRLVVRMPNDLARFRGSLDDIELRRGDSIYIPKVPEFVLVTGQVYNSNAITYRPHHDARWYLRQAGGPTTQANRKDMFIIRANGSVVGNQGSALWNGGVQSTPIEHGDTIVVPEKAIGGTSPAWKNLIAIAQLAQAAATSAFIVTH